MLDDNRGGPNPLGFSQGNRPIHGMVTGAPNDVVNVITSNKAWTNGTDVVFTARLPRGCCKTAIMLSGIQGIEPTTTNAVAITNAVKKALRHHPDIANRMDDHHDRVDVQPYDREKALDKVIGSLVAKGRTDQDQDKTEWTLQWRCPTYTSEGEYHWISTLRNIPITTPFGTINRRQAPVVWCNICHHNDHTLPYCPFPNLSGWPTPPNNGGGQGGPGPSNGGGRGSGRGFRGNRGGRGGRGRGSA
ncbi:hypothetical protein MD484_g8975, partial [Candolleomyces efflorescens]